MTEGHGDIIDETREANSSSGSMCIVPRGVFDSRSDEIGEDRDET